MNPDLHTELLFSGKQLSAERIIPALYHFIHSTCQCTNSAYQWKNSPYQCNNTGQQCNNTGHHWRNSPYQCNNSGQQCNNTGYHWRNSPYQCNNTGHHWRNIGHQWHNSAYQWGISLFQMKTVHAATGEIQGIERAYIEEFNFQIIVPIQTFKTLKL